jgi:hypothetical protein
MIGVKNYIESVKVKFPKIDNFQSWKIIKTLGNNYKIGANPVLSPGIILDKNTVVKQLELIEQTKR